MDPINSKKQSIKVIISETLMVFAIIATVIILALLVSGYWLNSNFQVERNGMLQISSFPTGANVEIDGEASSWLERTNSSKILSSGEHSVTLTKDGYDSWSKTINISEGLLYRLHYPRLFLNERTATSVLDTSKYTSATISSTHNLALLINDTTEWKLLNLDADEPKSRTVDISKLFTAVTTSEDGKTTFTGKILATDWDADGSHVLMKVATGDNIEWVLLDVNSIDKSVNLTKEFGVNFTRLEILDNNSNNLIAVQNHNLHRIDVPGRHISAVLVKDVDDFDHFNNEIVFSTLKVNLVNDEEEDSESEAVTPILSESKEVDTEATGYRIGYFKLGDKKAITLTHTNSPAKVAISKFYDSKYITIIENEKVSVYQKETFEEQPSEYGLSFVPDKVKVGHEGEFILFIKDRQIATLDMEGKLIREWNIEGSYGMLDNDMFYAINEAGDVIVYDFDGLNRRIVAHEASASFPVSVTGDKWLYYFSKHNLIRENLAPR